MLVACSKKAETPPHEAAAAPPLPRPHRSPTAWRHADGPGRQDGQGHGHGDGGQRRQHHRRARADPRSQRAGHEKGFKAAPDVAKSVKVGDEVAFDLKLEGGARQITAITKQQSVRRDGRRDLN